MHQTSKRPRGSVLDFLLGLVGGLAVAAYAAGTRAKGSKESVSHTPASSPHPRPVPLPPTPLEPTPHLAFTARRFSTRLAFAATFAVLFFAGASLTAFGGDQLSKRLSADDIAAQAADTTASADVQPSADAQAAPATPAPDTNPAAPAPDAGTADPTSRPAPAAPAPVDTAPAAASVVDASTVTATGGDPSSAGSTTSAPVVDAKVVGKRAASHGSASSSGARAQRAHKASRAHASSVTPKAAPIDPEANTPGMASLVWINRALPDPTPPSARLNRSFERMLYRDAKNAGADWALVYGVLRATENKNSRVTASADRINGLAAQLAGLQSQGKDEWSAAAAVLGDTTEADRAVALAHYARGVGTETLVSGLESAKQRLERRILNDPRISIYAGGRSDLENHRVDVRVVAVIAYLADTFGSVEVSCLITGHRLFARPGVISAHIFGRAVDIAALGGVSITGHQEAGGLTEHAVRDLLLMPGEVEPVQIISLLGLGGPSFALANHFDHIHIGY